MKKTSLAICLAVIGVAAAGAARAEPAITKSSLSLMSGPNSKGRVLLRVPANAEVDVGDCRNSWCEVSWQNTFGYAPLRSLDLGDFAEGRSPYSAPVYAPAPVYVGPPPVVYGGGFVIGPRPRAWWGYRGW